MISLVIDHLLESTVFALLMGQLTLFFANNRASVRYGLWFAASVKFLIPFSLIAAAGNALRWDSAPAVAGGLPQLMASTLPDFVPDLTLPDMALPAILKGAATADVYLAPLAKLPAAIKTGADLETWLLGIWLAGCVVLLAHWMEQWWYLRVVRKASTPAPIAAAIPVRFSRMLFEPGLVGVFRPVMLLPDGITAQLSPAQLTLVIEHELCHWRRRDNLTAAVHMGVQLVFWFHPLLWLIGKCLVAERERACDETVLATGNDPKAYASSILEVCRFYVRSPLPCAPGVAGANLTHRVERIMNNVSALRLSRPKRALLTAVAAGAVFLPMASGLLTPPAAAALLAGEPAPALANTPAAQRPLTAPQTKPATVTIAAQAPLPAQKVTVRAASLPARSTEPAAKEIVVASVAPAAAPTPAPPASPSMEEIVVTGKKIREFVRTRNFVRMYTAPSDFLDQIARWHDPLCVRTQGLTPAYSAFVVKRVAEIAAQVGAPTAQNESCKTNLSIIFSDHPQELLNTIAAKRPELLGPHYPALRQKLITVNHPVQAWYATATRDFRGRREIDTYDAWGGVIPGMGEFDAPVYTVPGSHLRSGLTSEFAAVIVVVDKSKVSGWETGTIADAAAMMALARMNTPDKCQQVPSIANALTDCGDNVKTKSLSDFDLAYLKALYATAGDAPRGLQESGISRVMLQILEKPVAGAKSP